MSKVVLRFMIIFLFSTALYAQTAQLSGTVRDPSNAAIPRATVEARDQATGARYRTQTNETGSYTLPYLTPGTYDLTVEAPGFRTARQVGVRLEVAQRAQLDFALEVGAVEQSVEVEAGAPLVNTQDAAVKTTINRQFVANLPLNGRSFQSLLQLVPGVVPSKVAGEGGQFAVNGQRAGSNYFTVDGVSANVGISTGPIVPGPAGSGQAGSGALPGFTVLGTTNNLVSVDALEEFSIQTSSYAPEYGRTPGAQVSLVTRSGTNDFHGTAFDYFRNDVLDANDWFANRDALGRSALRQNQFGGVLGGPVLLPGYSGRNRTFFFVSYEGLRLRQPRVANSVVPTIAARQTAPNATRLLLEAFPRPTGADLGNGLARYSASYSTPSRLDTTSIRLDHRPSSRWSVFGRYQNAPSVTEDRKRDMPANLRRTRLDTQGVTLGATVAVTPSLVNDLRYNLTRIQGSRRDWMDSFGGAAPPADTALFPPFAFSRNGYASVNPIVIGSFAVGTDAENRQWQNNLVESLSWTKGAHVMKFGADWRQLTSRFGTDQRSQYRPSYNFNGVAGLRSARMLSGLVNVKETVKLRFRNLSLYAQDTWRASRRLTLTYGLRYELNPPPAGVDRANQPFTINSLDPLGAVALAPPGTPLYQTTKANFAPRLGAAYQLVPDTGRQLVLRVGWGLFYDLGTGMIASASGAFPFLRTKRLPRNTAFPLNAAAAAPLPVDAPPPYDLIRAFDPGIVLPRTHQFNVTLEQSLGINQIFAASYVGALGRQLLRQENIFFVSPTIDLLQLTTNRDRSDYHALQLQFQRRFSRGVQALASYTWAKALDTSSTETGLLPRSDRHDPRQDRGPADFDVRHAFTAAFSWSPPAVTSNALVKAVLSGWSLDSTVIVRSAMPVTVMAFRTLDLGTFAVRPDLVPGIPLYVADPVAPEGRRINSTPVAGRPNQRGPFAFPAEIRQGNLGRNTLRGLAFHQVDLALRRRFHFTERLALDMRAEAFNLFNHPNFADPIGSLGSVSPAGAITFNPNFGLATTMLRNGLQGLNPLYQVGGPRSLQLALKLLF